MVFVPVVGAIVVDGEVVVEVVLSCGHGTSIFFDGGDKLILGDFPQQLIS